jgi:hypothetical protein
MEPITEKLIPGIVALLSGIILTIYWRSVIDAVLASHSRFWVELLKLDNSVNSFGRFFLTTLVLVLGIGLILAGLLLLYKYWSATH